MTQSAIKGQVRKGNQVSINSGWGKMDIQYG